MYHQLCEITSHGKPSVQLFLLIWFAKCHCCFVPKLCKSRKTLCVQGLRSHALVRGTGKMAYHISHITFGYDKKGSWQNYNMWQAEMKRHGYSSSGSVPMMANQNAFQFTRKSRSEEILNNTNEMKPMTIAKKYCHTLEICKWAHIHFMVRCENCFLCAKHHFVSI